MIEHCLATKHFMQHDLVKNNAKLVDLLLKRMYKIEKAIPYFRIVDNLKKKRFFNAMSEMICNPYFFNHLITEVPRILFRKFSYYLSRISQITISISNCYF